MERVGIRELKANLSAHLQRVRAGTTLVVTDRGKDVATISPAQASADTTWAWALVSERQANWSGSKPAVTGTRVPRQGRASVADAVVEDRR